MKKFSFLALAVAGMLLAACSSDKDVAEESKLNQYDMIEGQSAWIAVGIAMPGDPVTRGNDDLDDGDGATNEYTVYSGKIVLFKGPNEADAKLVKEYNLPDGATFNVEKDDNVPAGGKDTSGGKGEITSTSAKIVTEIETPSLGAEDNLYVYVILNDVGNTTGIEYDTNEKFSDFKDRVLKAIGIEDEALGFGSINAGKGFVMTSVPIASHPGGNNVPDAATQITTLAKVDPTAIYKTKSAAETGTAVACAYVERAAAKVQVKATASNVVLPDGTTLAYELSGWGLGNINSKATGYYNTRKYDAAWNKYINKEADANVAYRMIGRTNFFASGHTTAYRTYFGEDVNFKGNAGLINAKLTDAQHSLAKDAVTYTYENTFDADNQKFMNTTYVGFKVTIGTGTDKTFYTIEGQPNTYLKTDEQLSAAVAANATSTIATAITNIDDAISTYLATSPASFSGVTKVKYTIKPKVTVSGTKNATTGAIGYSYKLELSEWKDQSDADLSTIQIGELTGLSNISTETAKTYSTGLPTMYEYTGGVAYYAARISHFAQAETPWTAPNEAYDQYGKIYPTDAQSLHSPAVDYGTTRAEAWLGRWGVVRNNWYEVTVSQITGLGSPVPVDYSSDVTPDDNPEPKYYIATHIHILPWVKRAQSVNLK